MLLWVNVTGNEPANFEASVRQDRYLQAAKQVASWTVADLHGYLSRDDVWHRPSFTKAVIDEVTRRMRAKNFSPSK